MNYLKQGSTGAKTESISVPIISVTDTRSTSDDFLTVEEPLEIRVSYDSKSKRDPMSLAVAMRTPGHDLELVTGFLFSEGLIRSKADLETVEWLDEPSLDKNLQNVAYVELTPSHSFEPEKLIRNLMTSSSCGVCSKSSIESLEVILPPKQEDDFRISSHSLKNLPHKLTQAQAQFRKTGGLHACATFSPNGSIEFVAEDVGRHNAMDKLLGSYLNRESNELRSRGVLLSGRASFELLHKAAIGSVPFVASIGPPSSLALELAATRDISLVGFLKNDGFNIYNAAQRIDDK